MKNYLIIFPLFALLFTGCMTVSTSGAYTLPSNKTLKGDLIITSGEANLEEGSRVTGNVIMTSGSLNVDGEVDGDILYASAEGINLGPNSVVDGDIKGTSGDIFRAEGAWVGGQISTDQSFTLSAGFFAKAFGLLCGIPVALVGSLLFLRSHRRGERAGTITSTAVSGGVDLPGKLAQLKKMQEEGLISNEDYEAKKADLLADL